MLLVRNIYGDRIEGGGNRLVRDLDQCMDEPRMIGFRQITQKEPTTVCRCMAQKGVQILTSAVSSRIRRTIFKVGDLLGGLRSTDCSPGARNGPNVPRK
jgi:hypothetical protein